MLTRKEDLEQLAQKFWAPTFVPRLFEQTILPALVNRAYEGTLMAQGDTVKVSAINETEADTKTVGVDDTTTFTPRLIGSTQVEVVANKVITASYEIADLAELQTQLGSPDGQSKIRDTLMRAVMRNLNALCYGAVAPSTSAPDHDVSGVTNCDAAALINLRKLASQSYWPEENRWFLADPSYYADMLAAQTLTSSDYVGSTPPPVIGGKIVNQRFGFNIVEDASVAMKDVSPTLATTDLGLAFNPDWLYLVTQQQPTFRIGDKLANNQLSYVIVVSMVCGVKLGIDGAVKHIAQYNV
jgi:hypothetical protein